MTSRGGGADRRIPRKAPEPLLLALAFPALAAVAAPLPGQDTTAAEPEAEAGADVARPPSLDSVRADLPERLTGLDRMRAGLTTDTLDDGRAFDVVVGVYRGSGPAFRELRVAIVHGEAGHRELRRNVLAEARKEAVVTESVVDGDRVFTWTTDRGGARLASLPGALGVGVSGRPSREAEDRGDAARVEDAVKDAYRQLRDDVLSRFPSARRTDAAGEAPPLPDGFVRSTVSWSPLSFSLLRPEGWALVDMTRRSGGMLKSLVLVREPDVAREQYGPEATFSTGDTVSLGSATNVTVTLSVTPADPAETSPEAFLRAVNDASALARLLPEGQLAGDVRRRPVRGDTLAALPYRGRDREARRVTGWFYALPLDGVLLEARVMVGPDASGPAVDAAERIVASVGPVGSHAGASVPRGCARGAPPAMLSVRPPYW